MFDKRKFKFILDSFEAGAISTNINPYICTLLIDLDSTDLEDPLAQFQHTKLNKEEIKDLVITINKIIQEHDEHGLQESELEELFESLWSEFEKKSKELLDSEVELVPLRSDRGILEELLENVRLMTRNLQSKSKEFRIWEFINKEQEKEIDVQDLKKIIIRYMEKSLSGLMAWYDYFNSQKKMMQFLKELSEKFQKEDNNQDEES